MAFLIWGSPALAITQLQTSTSLGYYRDFSQNQHFPVFHSWSTRGLYDDGIETSIDFVLNNDFALNQWKLFFTQAYFQVPFGRSRVQLGRQFIGEGFEVALLDGGQAPIFWSESGGVMPYGGLMRSTDVDQPEASAPLAGLTLFQELYGIHLRGGWLGRDDGLQNKFFYGSLLTQAESLPFSPQIFLKDEFKDTGSFNQSFSELSLYPFESVQLFASHSLQNPRTTQKKEETTFLYKLFSISPSEIISAGGNIDLLDGLSVSGSGRQIIYDSGYYREVSHQQDVSIDAKPWRYHRFVPSFTHLISFGGEAWASGLRYQYEVSDKSQLQLEGDGAYFSKITNVKSWAYHGRAGFQTALMKQTTGLAYVEFERNQYFDFDTRVMLYVTNYL